MAKAQSCKVAKVAKFFFTIFLCVFCGLCIYSALCNLAPLRWTLVFSLSFSFFILNSPRTPRTPAFSALNAFRSWLKSPPAFCADDSADSLASLGQYPRDNQAMDALPVGSC